MYFCSIEPVNRIPLSETSTLEGQISMTVHLHSMDHSSSLSQQQVLTFLSAFHVKQSEIILTDVQPSSLLVISASPSVQRCIVVCFFIIIIIIIVVFNSQFKLINFFFFLKRENEIRYVFQNIISV